MSEVQISEHTKLHGTVEFEAMANGRENSRVFLWDKGPKRPESPLKPVSPRGKEGTPEYDLAMVDFKLELEDYQAKLLAFRKAKNDYDDWQIRYGGPYEIVCWSVDAQDALRNDPHRYCVSSRTRGYSKLDNRGLPPGMKPGHGQAELERREREGEEVFAEAVRRDPVFGQTESRA